jgi:hypothetical protein
MDHVIIATYSVGDEIKKIKVKDYKQYVVDRDKAKVADMVFYRLYGRFIKPFAFDDDQYRKHYKNGFAMMASACLLIESLEAFKNGWEETSQRGNALFDSFFKEHSVFRGLAGTNFYANVRCGILHQGETTGGFSISREPKIPLFDKTTKRINAYKFLKALEAVLVIYKEQLTNHEWDSEIWDNFRRKMRFVIKHCKS